MTMTNDKQQRAAIYARVSTLDQNPESQLIQLRQAAEQRGLEMTGTYTDHGVSGARARRPQLDRMLDDAHHGRFDVLLIWSFDRLARSVRDLLDLLDQLHRSGIELIAIKEAIDTRGPLGRAITVILGAIAELERSLIVERVRAGMARARLEGQRLGRPPLENLDRDQILADRHELGYSLKKIARLHEVSKTTVLRVLKTAQRPGPKRVLEMPAAGADNKPLPPAA
jgi:DNA invertase Pin-like site-specific DNA recombinase